MLVLQQLNRPVHLALLLFFTHSSLPSSIWPEFRGPTGQGTVSSEKLPLKWSDTENVRWKTPIHGRAWSSPVLDENQIWLSTANEKGTELSALCVDPESGNVVHDMKLFK